MAKTTIQLNFDKTYFNEAYLPYLFDYSDRFMVFYGGGGSGKSHFAVQRTILKALIYPNRRVLVVRKVQNSIRDSIFELFKQILSEMKILNLVEYTTTYLEIHFPNGSHILFKGLDDSEKIKSITGIDDIVIEEATELTLDDFTQLNLRLRSSAPNQQLTLMFNPVSKLNWVYPYFFKDGTPEATKVIHTTYKDNKFLPEDYVDSLETYRKSNPLYYAIYALGEFANLGKTVFNHSSGDLLNDYTVKDFNLNELLANDHADKLIPSAGLDFGYSADPTTIVQTLIDYDRKLVYVFGEEYQKGLHNGEIADLLLAKGMRRTDIYADSAEPKSIAEIKGAGVKGIQPVKKGNDSIRVGIQYMKQFHFIISPSCEHLIQELQDYSYVKDKQTGLYTNEVTGADHVIDSLRYSMQAVQFTSKVTFLNKSVLGL